MALFLIESSISNLTPGQVQSGLDQLVKAGGRQSELIESQVSEALQWLFIVLAAPQAPAVLQAAEHSDLEVTLVKEVRLVGQSLAAVRSQSSHANYLVEWNLPAGLTMATYLARHAEQISLYNKVPEVTFERTYVCQDLSKSLCFYSSPSEFALKRARALAEAPIDMLTLIHSAC